MSRSLKILREQPQELYSVFPQSVYLHVPFCKHRCGYCDFSLIAGREQLIPRYLNALQLELEHALSGQRPEMETVYIGGGTPTLLSPAELSKLLDLIDHYFAIGPETEFTFEANPDGFTAEKQKRLSDRGVNRISLGVQSLDDGLLKQLERTHQTSQTLQVIEQIQSRFENLSLDLIFGIPGQTKDVWQNSLNAAIATKPQHFSCYALTYEKGTQFWTARQKGNLQSLPEELESEMYQLGISRLHEAGYQQYEISSFAKPGFQSRHNTVYWTGKPYFAFGPGASSYLNGVRRTNHRSPFTWMKRVEQGGEASDLIDELSPEERARELIAIGLRQLTGVSKEKVKRLTGVDIEALLEQEFDALVNKDWLKNGADIVVLTEQGRWFADAVACEII